MEKLYLGDCLEVLPTLPDNSVDSIVTDPPYELGFMGKSWDNSGIAYNVDMWKECLRVLKPGGHLLSFSGTRTYHRMAVAIEDAGFEVRDMIEWCYGSGFPKSLNIGKAVDKLQGNEREVVGSDKSGSTSRAYQSEEQTTAGNYDITKGTSEWEGWGTALKPAHEPICLARKPLAEKTVAENVLKYGTGGINIDESRVGTDILENGYCAKKQGYMSDEQGASGGAFSKDGMNIAVGRFPANLIHDNSEEVRECFPETKSVKSARGGNKTTDETNAIRFGSSELSNYECGFNDSGNASRFFKSILYYPKASKSERNKGMDDLEAKPMYKADGSGQSLEIFGSTDGGREDRKNNHPTVKPTALMSYLIKMITPKGGIVLDPFAGSGSTLVAAKENGFGFIGIELTEDYIPIIEARTGVKAIRLKNTTEVVGEQVLDKVETYEIKTQVKTKMVSDKKSGEYCSCGGRIVKTKSGVLTCEDCLTDY